MFDQIKNQNVDAFSDAELKALVEFPLPVTIISIDTIQKLFGEGDASSNNLCQSCHKATTCKTIYDRLET